MKRSKKNITIAQHNISGSNIVISNETKRAQSLSVQTESDYALKRADKLKSTNQSLKEEIIQYNNELLELTTQRNTFETSLKQHLTAIETLYQTLNISKTQLFKDLKKIAAREDFFFIETLKQSTLWQCLAIRETLFTTENNNPSYFVKMLLNDNIESLIDLLALYPDHTKVNINKPLKTPSKNFTSKTTTSKVFFLTPLFLAAYFGKLNLIKALVESYNADLNLACTFNFSDSTTFTHITPLQIAVMFGHKPVIKYLKRQGAKTNTFVNKQHPLTFALIDAKAKDVTHFDFYETALNNTLSEEVFACQVDAERNTALHQLVQMKDSMVYSKVTHSSVWLQPNKLKNTPFHLLDFSSFHNFQNIYLNWKDNTKLKAIQLANLEGNSPLHLAALHTQPKTNDSTSL